MKDKTTYIYFIQSGYGSIKVGMSKNPEKRMANIQTCIPKSLRLVAKIPMPDRQSARCLEKELHQLFAPERIRGEWFNRRIVRIGRMKNIFGGTLKAPYFKGISPDTT